MRIQHNIMAMNAYRNYNRNTSALSKNLERLSSGYKINRAGDDAAGLAISEKMRAQITGLEAAQKNVKDGISLVNTTEGAMQEIQDMLNRMVSLATQSANGTYDNEVDRKNLQAEVDQLRSEIDRIADSANFNGIKLLDGSLDTEGNPTITGGSDRIIQDVWTSANGDPAKVTGTKTVLDGVPATENVQTVFEMDFSDLKPTGVAGTPAVKAEYTSAAQTFQSAGGTEATYTSTSFTTASTTSAGNDSYTVSIGGKSYDVADTNKTVADQAAAWAEAYNADAANTNWTAESKADGSIVLTYKDDTQHNTDPGDSGVTGTFADGDGAGTAATITVAAAGTASTTATNSKVTVTIDGKSYDVDKSKTSASDQLDAWIKAYNDDPANTAYTATKSGTDKVLLTEKVASDVTANNTGMTGGTFTNGVAGTPGGTMTIGGKTVTVSGATLDAQLKEFADAWNADTTASADWTASVGTGADAGKIVFTAKTAGAVGGEGPAAAPTGADEKTEGKDAVAADDKFTVKLNNVKIAEDVELDSTDTAATIAEKVFTELGGTAGTALTGVDLFGDDTLYKVEQSGTKLKFTLESTPTADNIKGNFDWDIESDTVFAGNHTAGTNVLTPGSVESAGVRANTVFEIKGTDLVDGAKITIDDKTVTLSVGVNSTVKAGAGVVSLTDAEAADLHLALGKISEGFGGGTTNFEVSVNNGNNGDAKVGLAVYKKATSKESYTTKPDLEAVFSLSTPGKGEGKALTLQIGDTSDDYNQLNVSVKDMHCDSLGIDKIDISNPDGAAAAINTIRNAINTVSAVRGNLGAISNRLDHTSNNLSVMRENIQDAESTIRDTDIAEEMMSYTKNNILVQSAQAMLAQANQVPQGVLQLLQ